MAPWLSSKPTQEEDSRKSQRQQAHRQAKGSLQFASASVVAAAVFGWSGKGGAARGRPSAARAPRRPCATASAAALAKGAGRKAPACTAQVLLLRPPRCL